jgi:hypothetical protein
MKKLILLSAVAALGMIAMSASALPKGYESVNFHATLYVKDGSDKVIKVSGSNKDLLTLVGDEYGTLPSGAQLVSYGATEDEFAVLNSSGTRIIEDASYDGGDYDFYYEADDGTLVENNLTGDTYNYEDVDGYLYYRNAAETYTFYLEGAVSFTDNYDNDNETYSEPNASGTFTLPIGVGDDDGVITGGLSGSGNDVDTY